MQRPYFQKLEQHDNQLTVELTEIINNLAFNEQGLIPVRNHLFRCLSTAMVM